MKRAVSIFMLQIALIIGISPVIGAHFCGEKLRSIELLSKEDSSSCCEKQSESPSPTSVPSDSNGSSFSKVCCQTKQMEVDSYTYQPQERLTNIESHSITLEAFWTPLYSKVVAEVDTALMAIIEREFPPEGYDVKNSDILLFISVLRI